MPNLIKIGFTKRSPEERKRELSRATGVPLDFEIKYEIFTHEMKILEQRVHSILEDHRINKNKEFFDFDLYKGIEVLEKCARQLNLENLNKIEGIGETFEKYESMEILGELNKKYPEMIRKKISSIRIYQTSLRCYLEITEDDFITKYEHKETPLINKKITRQDMAYILDGEKEFDFETELFKPENSVSKNAILFLDEFDDYSKLVCCSEIFNDYGCDIIQKERFKNKNNAT